MNLRHAVALAAAGWYLMVPPVSHTDNFEVNADAPLSHWIVYQAFDQADDCTHTQDALIERHKKNLTTHPSNPRQVYIATLTLSQCIATDDPRLKEK